MSSTPDFATCPGALEGRTELLPLSPFNSLHFNFGMLLGVDDFETEQAYHRAKVRIHNAWLHREGVVWGFGVRVDQTSGEIRVAPGLALDSSGRELHLEDEACLNVGKWFEEHESDADFHPIVADKKRTFSTHVVIRFRACLTRQIPALMEPCDNAGTGTAYSRVFETVEILMLPNQATQSVKPYHRLRLLFGLDTPKKKEGSAENTPEDQAVVDEIGRILLLPQEEQSGQWLAAFHRFAALDEIEMKPATTEDGGERLLFPGRDSDFVLLANINDLTITKTNDGWTLNGGEVDNTVRPTHVATTTIQDLLCGKLSSANNTPLGPRIDPATVTISDTEIVLKSNQALHQASVKPDNFSVAVFDNTTGWKLFTLTATLDSTGKSVSIKPTAPPFAKGLTRIVARGTGATPLIGTNKLPLAGQTNSASQPQGSDFVLMKERN